MTKDDSKISHICVLMYNYYNQKKITLYFIYLIALSIILIGIILPVDAYAQQQFRAQGYISDRNRAGAEASAQQRARDHCRAERTGLDRIIEMSCSREPAGHGNAGSWHCTATAICLSQGEFRRRQDEARQRRQAEAAAQQRAEEEQRRQQAAAAAQQRAAQERRAREEAERQREEEERLRQEEEARLLAEAERAQREEEDRLRREAEEAERARREELAQAGLEAVNRCNPPYLGSATWLGLGVSVEPGMYVSSHYPRGGDFSRPENYACQVRSPLAACEGLMCSEAVRIRMDHMVRRDVGEGALRNHGTCYDVAVRRVSAEMRYSPVPSRANIEQDGFTEPSSLFGPLRAARDAEWNARVNHVARMFRSAHQENVTRVAQCLESAGFNFAGQSLQEFDMWGVSVDTIGGGEEGGARPGDPG
jgi:flagellar biosynthesis GTPase FlhF